MKLLTIITLPISFMYGFVMYIRNICYDIQLFKSTKINNVLVISVGNLTVGGTGKTPHVEYLIRLLNHKNKAILSRGYGRNTKGVIMADKKVTPSVIGDEPFQYFTKFGHHTEICVAENRVEGALCIKNKFSKVDTIILDDAFQHRAIYRNVNLLITDFSLPFFNDNLLPLGRLRELKPGVKRADAIVVSKCPSNLDESIKYMFEQRIKKYTSAPVFFSKIIYEDINKNVDKCLLVTGIANATPLKKHITKLGIAIVKHFDFTDHYHYSQADIEKFRKYQNIPIITTEKDYVKISQLNCLGLHIIKIPIKVTFFDNDFDIFINNKTSS